MTELEEWQARALAAERTVDVLKRKVKDLYNGGSSNVQRAVERARAREIEMRRRQELMAVRNAELQNYNAKLEAEVRARTHDIRVIVDNVVFGFLVVGRDGTVRDGYTRSCAKLLGHDQFVGVPAIDALRLTGAAQTLFTLQLELLFDDVMPEEVVLDQFPCRTIGANDRILQLEGRAIRDDAGTVEAVLFTITDVTALDAAERDNAHYRLLVSILRQRASFAAFVASFHALLHSGREAALAGDELGARRAMHTIKGEAGCFGLAYISDAAHAAEDEPVLTAAMFDALAARLAQFLTDERAVLGAIADERQTVEVTPDQLAELATCTTQAQVADWIARAERRPVQVLLGSIEALVLRLAERFSKQVELVVDGGELCVDAELLAPIIRELGHLVRNAVDHGIDKAGRVTLRFADDGEAYRIVVEDDGRGIDVQRLAAKALEKGAIAAHEVATATPQQLVELAFAEGVSTADPTTDISGRGIGMSAVRAAVAAARGTIELHSEPGRGTRVEITIPARATAVSKAA